MSTELSLLEQVEKMSTELIRLKSRIVRDIEPVSTLTITRDDFAKNVDALIAVMPALAFSEYGIADIYNNKENKMAHVKDMKIFSCASKNQDTPPIFCAGPGIYVNEDKKHVEPMWGFGGIYPHLIAAGHSFFNGQLPLNSTDTYIVSLFTMARRAAGRAIITLYPQPWSSFFETALLFYFIGTGSSQVYVIGPQFLQDTAMKCPDIKGFPNIVGTYYGTVNPRERRVELAALTAQLLRNYSDVVGSPRFFHNFHASPGPDAAVWSLQNDLERLAKGQDRFDTIANAIATNPKMFDSVSSIPHKTREIWRASILASCQTDIGVVLHTIFYISLLTSATAPVDSQRTLRLVYSAAAAIVTNFLRLPPVKPDENYKDMYPVIVFLNALLPENLKISLS
jgi:hypothetical protein